MGKIQAYSIIFLTLCALLAAIIYLAPSGNIAIVPAAEQNQEPPALTPLMQAQLEKSTGFDHFVSYTDQGFMPKSLSIKQGETVRFTNNSSSGMWVASSEYPGTSECGGSSFDTCIVLDKNEFWEFTFKTSGTWSYRNNASTENVATLTIEVQ